MARWLMISGLVVAAWTTVGCEGMVADEGRHGPDEAGFVLHACMDAIAHVSRGDDLDRAKALALQGLEHAGTDLELRRLADTTLAYVILMRDGLQGLQVHLGSAARSSTPSRGPGLLGEEPTAGLEVVERSAEGWGIDRVRAAGAESGAALGVQDPGTSADGRSCRGPGGQGPEGGPSACAPTGRPSPVVPSRAQPGYPIYVDL